MVLGLTACDEIMTIDGDTIRLNASASASGTSVNSSSSEGSRALDAITRARPAEIDLSKYTMIVPVEGSAFRHELFKSPVHAQEAGYCLTSGYGSVTKVIQASDPRTRQSFYFIECEKADPAQVGVNERIAALEAEQAGYDARTAEMRAAAEAAASQAGTLADPYADCPIGQGGYPIVRDGCGPKSN